MIRTVLGDIPASSITGNAYVHEHIQCAAPEMLRAFGSDWLDESALADRAVSIFQQLREQHNVALFTDGTPPDLGRNVRQLREVSRRSGVHIVASTGLYYYPSQLTCQRTPEQLADIFTRECENGMEGTDSKPGILKCAVDADGVTPDIAKRMTAMALVQQRTGLPLYVHCKHVGNSAHEMLDIFEQNGADLAKIAVGHCTFRLEEEYLLILARCGIYLSFDQCFPGMEQRTAACVRALCDAGYADKLLFSLDRPIYNDFERAERTDYPDSVHFDRYAYLFAHMLPAFADAGCTEEQVSRFTTANPIQFLNR